MKKSRAEYKRQLRARKRALLPPQTCYRCRKPMNKRLGAKFCSDFCRQPLSAVAADKRARRYFRQHRGSSWTEVLPNTWGELLAAIGITAREAALLPETFGANYWGARIVQAWPKAFPSGQVSPAIASMWNIPGRAFKGSINLVRKLIGENS